MVNSHESHDSLNDKQVGSEISLPDFMLRNFEQDPEWFDEPENTPDYGPPGMPTPLVPTDIRIFERQRRISNALRMLVSPERLPADIDPHLVSMLQMNFDSYNAILGVNNNGSYHQYETSNQNTNLLPAELLDIKDRAVLGLASQSELIQFIKKTEGLPSVELMKLYHAFMFRMRHLSYRRDETEAAIVSNGGKLAELADDNDEFYDLKLYPYTIEHHRELSPSERTEVAHLSRLMEARNQGMVKFMFPDSDNGGYHNGKNNNALEQLASDLSEDEAKLQEIISRTTSHEVVGMMASIKRRVGHVPKDENKQINVTERQLFAIEPSALHTLDQMDLQHIHARRKELDEQAKNVTEWVRTHFINNTDAIIPVSTTTYAYETKNTQFTRFHQLGALARLAEQRHHAL